MHEIEVRPIDIISYRLGTQYGCTLDEPCSVTPRQHPIRSELKARKQVMRLSAYPFPSEALFEMVAMIAGGVNEASYEALRALLLSTASTLEERGPAFERMGRDMLFA